MLHSGMVTYHEDLADLLVPIDSVSQHPDNPNNGDVEAIVESIELAGMYRPVYVQRSTGWIVAGNHTWEACKTLGATEIPVVALDIDEVTTLRILLGDNKLALLAKIDNGILLPLLEKITAVDSLRGTGYVEPDLVALRKLAEMEANYDDFAQWPLIAVRVPPNVRRAYLAMTEQAVGDRERFELMLRLAGWNGR